MNFILAIIAGVIVGNMAGAGWGWVVFLVLLILANDLD